MPTFHLRRALALASAALTAAVFASAASPLVASAESQPNEVGVAGTDSALWRLQDTPPPTLFESLGGSMLAAPAVVSVPATTGPGVPIYIATGLDHALWVRSRTQGWQRLASSFTFCVDNPAAVVVRSKPAGSLVFTVACQGSDHALWFAQGPISAGVLPDPSSMLFQSLGGVLVAGPAVTAVNPLNAPTVNDELTFFIDGQDGHVWTRTPNSPDWSQQPWSCIGHPAASAVLFSTPTGPGQESMLACQGTDRQLWLVFNGGGPWSPAFPAGGILVDGPGAAEDPNPNVLAVYAEGADGAVWRFDGAWTSLGGRAVHGAGAAALFPMTNNP